MKNRTRFILGMFALVFLMFAPSGTQADSTDDNSQLVNVIEGNYGDYDGDGYEDDVISIFEINNILGCQATIEGIIYIELILPSGFIHNYTINLHDTLYTKWTITIEWYNAASESGWYEINVELDSWAIFSQGITDLKGEGSLIFDPPDENPNPDPLDPTITDWDRE